MYLTKGRYDPLRGFLSEWVYLAAEGVFMPDWKSFLGMLGENWAVILGSMPLFLTILGVGLWLTRLDTQ
jgi:hypothetical protein